MRQKKVPLGVYGIENDAAALAALQQLLLSLKSQGKSPDRPRTVGEAAAAYLADREGVIADRTMKGYRWYLGAFVARYGTEPVLSIDDDRRKAIQREAARLGWSDDSRRNFLATAESALRAAGWPLRFDKPPRGSAGAGMVIPEAVYWRAVGSATGDLRALLVTLWNTGARPSEVTGLTAEEVDWSNATTLKREHKTAKKGKKRVLVFPPPAMEVLQAQREKYGSGLLFRTRTGVRFGCPVLTQAVWRVGKRIGHRITAYGCRHTFATDALSAGLPDTHVAALLGHGSTRMLHHHYSHLSENTRLLKDAVEKIRGKAG